MERFESSACDLISLGLITASIPQTAHWQWDWKDRKGEGKRRCFELFCHRPSSVLLNINVSGESGCCCILPKLLQERLYVF
jgi:hypothetical protein